MISRKAFQRYANDFAAFRDDLIIDVDGVARRLGDVMDDWQRDDFAALDPGLRRCIGRSNKQAIMRAYLERPRDHSKSTDESIRIVTAVMFSTFPIKAYVFAADRDQAALLRDGVERDIRLNPWHGEIIEVQRSRVINIAKNHPGAGSEVVISTSDVASSWGILPDLIICDELTHWEGDGSLWQSIFSSAAKRSNCLLCIISNAGFVDSWQWGVREAARLDDGWYFSRLEGPKASWLTPERLAEQKRMLPAIAYSRLWDNHWTSGGGDALTADNIDAAFHGRPMTGKEQGWLYVAGVDLGLTRDCSAAIVLAVSKVGTGLIRLAHHKLWRPTGGKKIELTDVEQHILKLDEEFGLEQVGFDPWQAALLAQRLEVNSQHVARNNRRRFWRKPWMVEMAPTAANLREQATLVIESFQDHRFSLCPCLPLRRDLQKLRVEEKSYGIRLVSPRDETGHGDTFSAFAMALVLAHEHQLQQPVRAGIIQPTVATVSRPSKMQRARERCDREIKEFEEAFPENTFHYWQTMFNEFGPSPRIDLNR